MFQYAAVDKLPLSVIIKKTAFENLFSPFLWTPHIFFFFFFSLFIEAK